jgi:dTDP-4-dehydrorhamnose reductase
MTAAMDGPVLVTGSSGQLGAALGALAPSLPGAGMVVVGRPQFDFDRPETMVAVLRTTAPSLVVNAAAYTAVDKAETEPEAAYRANRDAPAALAAWCADAGIPLIHISTDYVFDGLKGAPYLDTDPTSPTGVYGASKLAGEAAVLAACKQAIVLRTSWVYAAHGKNFVRTMLAARERAGGLRVVADQIGCPTSADDLAAAILQIVATIRRDGWQPDDGGLYHAAGTGWTSWHGLAVAVFEEAARHGVATPPIAPIATADWPTPAKRPPDSRLDCTRLAARFDVQLPPWRLSVGPVVDRLLA